METKNKIRNLVKLSDTDTVLDSIIRKTSRRVFESDDIKKALLEGLKPDDEKYEDIMKQHTIEFVLDFSDVTIDELLNYAISAIVIQVQKSLRDLGESWILENDSYNVRVRDILDNKRTSASPEKKLLSTAKKLLESGLSKDDIIKMLQNLDK